MYLLAYLLTYFSHNIRPKYSYKRSYFCPILMLITLYSLVRLFGVNYIRYFL